jgi:predicted nucleic acid-binding protein
MRYLLDTGILLRLADGRDPLHAMVCSALAKLHRAGELFVVMPQKMAEFWNVCTRPASARGGWGLSHTEAVRRLESIEKTAEILADPPQAYVLWRQLVINHLVSGVQVHDARLVASMLSHGIQRLITLNPSDFQRYIAITAVTPEQVMAASFV